MSASAPHEGRRRALHLATASLGLAAQAGAPYQVITVVVLLLALTAITVELFRRTVPSLNAALERVSAGMLRPSEHAGVTGATLLMIGYAMTWLVAAPAIAAPAMVVVAVADPAAAMIGRWLKPDAGRKTVAGSAGAFVAAAAVLFAFGIGWRATLAGATAAMLAERLPGRGVDNVAIPLCTAATLWVTG